MGCVVCGATPTVKSHIVPKALFHDMKRLGQQFIASRRSGQPGYEIPQSGAWDDTLLCATHEGSSAELMTTEFGFAVGSNL